MKASTSAFVPRLKVRNGPLLLPAPYSVHSMGTWRLPPSPTVTVPPGAPHWLVSVGKDTGSFSDRE